MSGKTQISWTDRTWNPVVGCTKVSQGCKFCYAKRIHDQRHEAVKRGVRMAPQYSEPFEVVQLKYERLEWPLSLRMPSRIFVNSVSDLFHEDVDRDFIALVFATMACAQRHVFQILTKRPARMRSVLTDGAFLEAVDAYAGAIAENRTDPLNRLSDDLRATLPEIQEAGYLPNVWLGVSVENQSAANDRVPQLLATPASARFLSCEPLLGPVDLRECFAIAPPDEGWCQPGQKLCKDPLCRRGGNHFAYEFGCRWSKKDNYGAPGQIDLVIAGGESGTRKQDVRPMHPAWPRSLRDQSIAAGLTFEFKQWGEYVAEDQSPQDSTLPGECVTPFGDEGVAVYRIGTRKAGRELDGSVHNASWEATAI